MTLPTINDVGAVDPVLTNMLVGYIQADSRFIASRLFPSVPVNSDSGTYYIVTKKYFFRDQLEVRAPGGNFRGIDGGVSTATYATKQWAGQIQIPDEVRANSQLPMDLEQIEILRLAQASLIRKEVQFGSDFMTTGVWGTDNTTATDWDDYASSDPVNDILLAARTISNNTGTEANTMAMGLIVRDALLNHPDIIDRIKYTQAATADALDMALSSVFGKNVLVGKATYTNTNEAVAFSATAIIDDDCLVCNVNPGAGIFGVTAGKTFAWAGGGGMGTMYRDPARFNHSDVAQHKEQWDQKVTASDVGYFFSDIV